MTPLNLPQAGRFVVDLRGGTLIRTHSQGGLYPASSGLRRQSAPAELTRLLQTKKNEQFVRCLSEKLLTYGLGRGLEYYDQCAVDRITEATAKDGYRFSTFVLAISNSEPFQKQGAKKSEDD